MGLQRTYPAHDDIQGVLGTALTGVTQWTAAQYRATGIVLNNVQSGDLFSMVFQFPHRKKLGTNIDSVHLHYVPNAAANGNIAFTFTWGWFGHGDVIPNTLPNTGSVPDIGLLTTDQYKLKLSSLLTNLAHPGTEGYSDILLVKFVAAAPAAGTNWWSSGGTNTIAIVYLDAHYITDRTGSLKETSDV